MLAVMETKAHLDVLVQRGLVQRRLDQGILSYWGNPVSASR
jgi:hypothetical protein